MLKVITLGGKITDVASRSTGRVSAISYFVPAGNESYVLPTRNALNN